MISKIKIYTDGAARGNPGPAGWAAVFLKNEKVFLELGGRSDYATNNQMELTAPIEAMKYLVEKHMEAEVEFYCDSKYVILGITEWIFNWQKNNWRNAGKKPVMNREYWEELYELALALKPTWHYVAGHADNVWNNRADLIATSFADQEPVKLKS